MLCMCCPTAECVSYYAFVLFICCATFFFMYLYFADVFFFHRKQILNFGNHSMLLDSSLLLF